MTWVALLSLTLFALPSPDIDGDSVVSFSDLGLMKEDFFTPAPRSDLNGDGIVNFVDLGILQHYFFREWPYVAILSWEQYDAAAVTHWSLYDGGVWMGDITYLDAYYNNGRWVAYVELAGDRPRTYVFTLTASNGAGESGHSTAATLELP